MYVFAVGRRKKMWIATYKHATKSAEITFKVESEGIMISMNYICTQAEKCLEKFVSNPDHWDMKKLEWKDKNE